MTTNNIKPLYLFINGGKYLTLIFTDESKDMLEKCEELLTKFKDLIRSTNNNSDDYDEKYMKIKFNLNDDLPLQKTLRLHDIIKGLVLDQQKKPGSNFSVSLDLTKGRYNLLAKARGLVSISLLVAYAFSNRNCSPLKI